MEEKNQMNQNPAEEIREEKTEVAVKATDNKMVNEQQLTGSEKEKISALIKDSENKPEKVKKPEEKKEENPVETKNEPKQEHEITPAEEGYILGLLRDTMTSGEDHEGSLYTHDKIDYDSLNKQELVELLEDVVEEKDITKIKSIVANIKVAFYKRNKEDIEKAKEHFMADGGDEKDFKHLPDPLEQRFNAAFAKFKHNKAKYTEELEQEKQTNLKKKLEILDQLRDLINSEETLKKTYDEFRKLQEQWKEIGMVPASELNNLWQSYHFLVEKFFDKVRINKELRDLDLKKNLEAKIALCEKAEELLMEDSIIKSFKLLQKYHDQWREIGPVPSDKKDAIWERFKAATDKINERRRNHYKELQEQQERNFEAKTALCEKAEEIADAEYQNLKEWQAATDKMNELLKVWKTIGRAPARKNDEVWARFKSSLDKFFSEKKAYLAKIKEQQINNYNLKIDLCVRAEALQDSEEWGKTTRELINLQKEWKKIGPVPRKHSDKIWARFRAACDHFFNRKQEHFKNLHSEEENNLKLKQELIKEVENYEVKDSKQENLEAVKSFQKRWLEIGHVPYAMKDKIHQQYKQAFEKLMDKMNINNMELSVQNYRNHLEMLKNSPDGERKLSRERYNLSQKIKKLEEDIRLLENNIGFFANSKTATSLQQDYEKNIATAKNELETLKKKIRLIDKMA